MTGALRNSGSSGGEAKDNTLFFHKKKFHWAWFIPIDDQVVSLGLVVPTAAFRKSGQTGEEFFRSYLPEINSGLKRRSLDIELIEKVHIMPNYSYQMRRFCRQSFICIGDAHRFIDFWPYEPQGTGRKLHSQAAATGQTVRSNYIAPGNE